MTGILVTYFFVPDMTGVDFVEEDARFMAYLADCGWQGEIGEDDDGADSVSKSDGKHYDI